MTNEEKMHIADAVLAAGLSYEDCVSDDLSPTRKLRGLKSLNDLSCKRHCLETDEFCETLMRSKVDCNIRGFANEKRYLMIKQRTNPNIRFGCGDKECDLVEDLADGSVRQLASVKLAVSGEQRKSCILTRNETINGVKYEEGTMISRPRNYKGRTAGDTISEARAEESGMTTAQHKMHSDCFYHKNGVDHAEEITFTLTNSFMRKPPGAAKNTDPLPEFLPNPKEQEWLEFTGLADYEVLQNAFLVAKFKDLREGGCWNPRCAEITGNPYGCTDFVPRNPPLVFLKGNKHPEPPWEWASGPLAKVSDEPKKLFGPEEPPLLDNKAA